MLILQRIVSPCKPSEPLTGTCYFTTKIINIKLFHITTFLPPSLARVFFRGTLPLLMAQQKRGFKFALSILLQFSLLFSARQWARPRRRRQFKNCIATMGVWRTWCWGYDDNFERRGASGNTPCQTLPPPRPTLPPQNSKSQTTFVQAHKINLGPDTNTNFMFMHVNTGLCLCE
jgi:hypothetical protein